MQNKEMSLTNGGRRVRGRLLFRFAVATDTHVNHEESGTTSPWPVNKLANGRTRHAFRVVNALNPEFLIHGGDMVHPTPTQDLYASAVERFHEIARELHCPVYLTPGNHDAGDKWIEWAPAKPITPETLAIYEKAFGPSYYSFAKRGCRFFILNSLLMGSGLKAESDQWAWLEVELDRVRNERIFAFIHDPPFTTEPNEADGYDNIPFQERDRLLALFAKHKVEAAISGHVHNFWYNRLGDTEFYCLPSTTFVRQDYSELYKIEPGDEGGRNDAAKLGIAAVDVYERGHILHVIRTSGVTVGPHTTSQIELPGLVHTAAGPFLPVGVDLRHPWAETMEIAPSSGVDEFGRKRARNDYPLQAFWEMGLAKLRVPVQDLAHESVRARMRLMTELGHEFTIYSYDIPRGAELDAIAKYSSLVSVWETILSPSRIEARLEALAKIKANLPFRIHLSQLRSGSGAASSHRFAHAINHGFTLEDTEKIETLLQNPNFRCTIDGLVYRVAHDSPVAPTLAAIGDFSTRHGLDPSIHVRLAAENPAEFMHDDVRNADRVAETFFSSLLLHSGATVFLDTFDDVDRGFFRRNGLYDRRFNPRMAGRVVCRMQTALRGLIGAKASELRADLPCNVLGLETAAEVWLLLKSSCEADLRHLCAATGRNPASRLGEMIDLASGASKKSLSSSQCIGVSAPTLLRFDRLPASITKTAVEEETA